MIDNEKEFPSDALLVQLVKLYLITEKVMKAPWSGNFAEEGCVAGPSAVFYLRSLESQLHDFKSSMPEELRENSEYSPIPAFARTTITV